MLLLKNVSKFYYSNGIVTSGFSKVNLELKKGEFVAITGESGSGKSTLLNVISGLDTYEEGEMLINGEETSAYSGADFENYRRKYIANIYQAFNLINSYTVYQNVEMVLLIAGAKRREVRKRVLEVLKQVDLYSYRNTKASKLSGGQKQRVAIARALVKDTPIIVADEPTGNLDSASAANVIELLSTLAADKLVIVVTHNYDQVEPYVTRKITMHDGRLTEDLVFRQPDPSIEEEAETAHETAKDRKKDKDKLKLSQRIRLGVRNTFNVLPKFLLLLFIFLFFCSSVTSFYANMRSQDYDSSLSGYNWYFNDLSDTRIILKKMDGEAFTEDDYANILSLENADYIYRDDVMIDTGVYVTTTDWEYYVNGELKLSSVFPGQMTYGRLPENEHEMAVTIPEFSYLNYEDTIDGVLNATFDLYSDRIGDPLVKDMKVVGVCVDDRDTYTNDIYITEDILTDIRAGINSSYSKKKVYVAGQEFECEEWSNDNKVVPSDLVERGQAIVSEDWNWYFRRGKAVKQTFDVEVSNLYYSETKTFTIVDVYNQKSFTKKTGYDNFDYYRGIILINTEDYNEFFDKDSYQSSLYVLDNQQARETEQQLREMGYDTLYMTDALVNYNYSWMVIDKIFNSIWSSVLIIVFLFICYFIIKLIMKSRNVYYATVRMLGGSANDCTSLIVVELLTVMNLAFGIMIGAIAAAYLGYFSHPITDTILRYLVLKDYIILYAVLTVMSVLIAVRFATQLFKSSAIKAYKEV